MPKDVRVLNSQAALTVEEPEEALALAISSAVSALSALRAKRKKKAGEMRDEMPELSASARRRASTRAAMLSPRGSQK